MNRTKVSAEVADKSDALKSPTRSNKKASIVTPSPKRGGRRDISPVSRFTLNDDNKGEEEVQQTSSSAKENKTVDDNVEARVVTPVKKGKVVKKKSKAKKTNVEQQEDVAAADIPVIEETEVAAVSSASVTHSMISKIVIDPRVSKIYKIIRKCTGTLGGNGYGGAIYGEVTMHSMQKVLNLLVDKCELTHRSRFIDIGAGLGKSLFINHHVSCITLLTIIIIFILQVSPTSTLPSTPPCASLWAWSSRRYDGRY